MMARYTHPQDIRPDTGPLLYEQGREQWQLVIERYHTLCAAIKGEYDVTTVPANPMIGQIFPRSGIVFTKYQEYLLEPVTGVKLHPSNDGTVHPHSLEVYRDGMKANWKCTQGGILYAIGCGREFWNPMLNYHSSAGTTGNEEWDELFEKVKEANFEMAVIPCMVSLLNDD